MIIKLAVIITNHENYGRTKVVRDAIINVPAIILE